ncbi:MAG: hypothetical protein EOO01_34550 [Chitinophagaceae bacterium]|nr:MAG: hypothetical protein EOO01_34550 [Chitinophagaceae bacterium]
MITILLQYLMWCTYASSHTPAVSKSPEHHIYFVGRASTQKSSIIATGFNLTDTLISHVGIGFKDKGVLKIFHVEDRPGNAFQISSLQQFHQPGIFYYCVYALPVSNEHILKLKALLRNHLPVSFDKQLLLNNEFLYCSEFCYNLLKEVNPEKFTLLPTTRRISQPFILAFLGRDTITYIPVDFFLKYPGIKKVECGFLP